MTGEFPDALCRFQLISVLKSAELGELVGRTFDIGTSSGFSSSLRSFPTCSSIVVTVSIFMELVCWSPVNSLMATHATSTTNRNLLFTEFVMRNLLLSASSCDINAKAEQLSLTMVEGAE
jgi:hypothetical protein